MQSACAVLYCHLRLFEKSSNIKFHENLSSGNRVVPCRQTDGQTNMTKLILTYRNLQTHLKINHKVYLMLYVFHAVVYYIPALFPTTLQSLVLHSYMFQPPIVAIIRQLFIHSLVCAECNDSLLFSGASSILLCCVLFPSIQFLQLVFHPSLLCLAIYFLVYLSALLNQIHT